ncbi:Adenosine 3'-phospho 5'-phosphosulfate transporter 1 [Seminavis robusta]|uniref:Adenosine 3'-phospho 5'-phosphosulfate transporter 1 n=1 Tax=Seminavis robusta TaxID=568900 RepID=A0A9N8HHH1_9STRA|nr:Adenosine 3'-phospho 5'-phosphosulfate transporter 1 [Seminavis robusta]|eukprot:Sro536_g162230.1 Adenosine 3'-phospho 5'-phosphosulfate transporter 1 (396) ;mRNA; r:53942-55234
MGEEDEQGMASQTQPLIENTNSTSSNHSDHTLPMGDNNDNGGMAKGHSGLDALFHQYFGHNPEFFKQAFKFALCFCGLQASYLTWGYMQELIMTTQFHPTNRVPEGKFPSAAFCVFSNRFLAVIVALISVRIRKGAFFANNKAPLIAFTPCALSNTMSSWSQYASLKYVSFPVQTVFKSSKIIPVMMMGKVLKGTNYPLGQYVEALLITVGVAIFSIMSKSSDSDKNTELIGLVFLLCYISFDSFTSQWQDRVYTEYGRANVDPYQMMLGVNMSAIIITTTGLLITGDFPIVWEFLLANPVAFRYNVITAITSASGQLCIFYTIKEFGPIAFTIIMTTRQMFSICISAFIFNHQISFKAAIGAILVFSVIFYQIRRKYLARQGAKAKVSPTPSKS